MKKKDLLNIIGLSISLIGAILLFFGSQNVPWDMQTWGGVSPDEVRFKMNKFFETNLGFGFLGFGFLLQLSSYFCKK